VLNRVESTELSRANTVVYTQENPIFVGKVSFSWKPKRVHLFWFSRKSFI